jgi:hypothetical protein
MAIASFVVAGFLAMGPHWSLFDLPYPEVETAESVEARVFETLAGYARSRSAVLSKGDVAALRIEGPRATARLTMADRTETVHLQLLGERWQVIKVE